ncbi:MAG: pyridoxal phosphate-dependent class II aminotransferase [Amphritea sp.]|nr:pyridoxal phosphate-dependent class II aminotransferase [Amphritea sp.]
MSVNDQLPLHGGDLITASQRYGIPVNDWLDLSTGLNPSSYPVPELDEVLFQRLPYLRPEFLAAAAAFYGNDQLMPSNGSQLVIQELPHCLNNLPVLLPEHGYKEHEDHWKRHGNAIEHYPAFEPEAAVEVIEAALERGEPFHLVVINPNNPTGLEFGPQQLKNWAERLPEGGYLIIDEAFIDLTPEQSVLQQHFCDNMLVLRSFGKFFGLAGIRLGFVFANAALRARLQERIGLWTVNGPAQEVAIAALQDSFWQMSAQLNIRRSASVTQELLQPLFEKHPPQRVVYTPLFTCYQMEHDTAMTIQRYLASRGVLIRVVILDEEISLLRFGIIDGADDAQIGRLEQIVADFIGES